MQTSSESTDGKVNFFFFDGFAYFGFVASVLLKLFNFILTEFTWVFGKETKTGMDDGWVVDRSGRDGDRLGFYNS